MKYKNLSLSKISLYHYITLFVRSLFLIVASIIYIAKRIGNQILPVNSDKGISVFFASIWLCYVIEMISRFFPSKLESPGCQKQFTKNYQPTGNALSKSQSRRKTLSVAIAWLALNAVIGILYAISFIDRGLLILISLAYGVCDMICILFFCPFQTWFMQNRCCTTCRIYNWDFAMMFTPFIFIPHFYTWSLLILSLALLLVWEISVYRHPERFSTATNAYISCSNCTEKLCKHKKQLQYFLKKRRKM